MRIRLVPVFVVVGLLAAACGMSREQVADDPMADALGTGSDGEEATEPTDPEPTTTTVPATTSSTGPPPPPTTAPDGEVAATIVFGNDASTTEILHGDVNAVAAATRDDQQFVDLLFGGSMPPAFEPVVLDQLVEERMVDHELGLLATSITDEDLAASRELLSGEIEPVLAASPDAASVDLDTLFEVPYLELVTRLTAKQQVLARALAVDAGEEADLPCARHILVATEGDADEVVAELAAGADFATVAEERSNDPGSAPRGGDLGCGPAEQYVAEFAEVITTIEPDVVSEPFESEFGWHVLIVEGYEYSNAGVLLGDTLTVTYDEATVTVDERLGTWDAATYTVIPPEA